jgi:hypothetical protein
MSTETEDMPGPTKPVEEHAWLHNLLGEWQVESEMVTEPGGPTVKGMGQETVKMLGELWAIGEGSAEMPIGGTMHYRTGLGYDVSFKEYRAFWLADVSSHLWKSVGELSEDGKVMTLHCEGPNMTKDGETANYKDVIEIVDENHRIMTSYGQDENGEWQQFMKAHYTRI